MVLAWTGAGVERMTCGEQLAMRVHNTDTII